MSELQFHPAANEFPLLDGKRLDELADDIRQNGQREPIRMYDGKIVDGRNRYLACRQLSIEPKAEALPVDTDPWAYVWSLNGARRDLTTDQRYLIWKSCHEKSEAWQAEKARITEEANRKRSEAQKDIPKAEVKERAATSSGATLPAKKGKRGKTTEAKAKASKTNRGTVERMDKLAKERPDLAEKVKTGEMKSTQALRVMKKDQVADKVKALPAGKFRVIYADPPWSYNDSRELGTGDGQAVDRASTAALNNYPTMSKAELCALDVKSLAAPDCVLLCWATFPLLPDCLDVVKAWGFKYKTAFVWDKQRGTLGNYHKAEAELLLVCTRGSGTPDTDKRENQVQRWTRGGHSAKPEAAREMIDRLWVHGSRIELFARGVLPANWVAWGNEAA